MAIKTKERILRAARLLFNEEGESNVAMVDVAAVLDISPGNLYYHYRGKEQLIPILVEQFESKLSGLELADFSALESREDRWAYCFLVMDTLYQYRCVHRMDAVHFDRGLAKRYRRIQLSLANIVERVIIEIRAEAALIDNSEFDDTDIRMLAENISLYMLAWVCYPGFNYNVKSESAHLHRGIYRMCHQVAAALPRRKEYLADCLLLMTTSMSEAEVETP